MEKEYIRNLQALAGIQYYSVSKQNLLLLREKYHLSDEETEEMKRYCMEHSISVFDEEERMTASTASGVRSNSAMFVLLVCDDNY